MKFTTIVLASVLAMGPTLALAQADGSNTGTDKTVTHPTSGVKNDHRTTGNARRSGRNTGDAITTGSDVPYDKPNLSNSPESSDTSQRVK